MPAAVAVVTGAADRRRRDRRPCPCPLRAGGLCAVRGEAPLLICSGAAGRRGRLPYGGSTRFMGVQLGGKGHRGRFTGLRLRCGDWRAAAGGCHCASLMMKRCAAAAAVRPCVRPDPGSPLSPFPQVTCLDWLGGPVLPPLSACGMRARRALAVLVWSGDGSPVWGCTTTGGVQVPPRTHRDHRLTCGYVIGQHFATVRCRLFPQVRTMGVQDGSKLRNGNSHRLPDPDSRDFCATCA